MDKEVVVDVTGSDKLQTESSGGKDRKRWAWRRRWWWTGEGNGGRGQEVSEANIKINLRAVGNRFIHRRGLEGGKLPSTQTVVKPV